VTERIKPPRAVFVPFRMGHHFGVPFHMSAQRRIITDALELIRTATHSGQIVDLPLRWGDLRREGAAIERQRKL
jgi:D-proline reductase (dithiol) PrdB